MNTIPEATPAENETPEPEQNERMARRAGIGAFVGTTVEMYDFYIFSTAAALVLGKLFFPSESPGVATLAAFGTIWVGFIARPLGGIIFGHLGDRVGRKKVLVLSLILTGIATAAVGFLPTYAQIGITAPILLILIRCVQGVALGGEWGGAVLIATEHAPKGKKVLYGAFAQQGSPAGNILSTLVFLLLAMLPESSFESWGWRIPFMFAALLVGIGVVVRLKLEESPEMKRLLETSKPVKLPLVEVLRSSRALLVLALCASAIAMAGNFMITVFTLSWATTEGYFDRSTFLTMIFISLIVQFIVQPLTAMRSPYWRMSRAIPAMLLPKLITLPLMFVLIPTGNFGLALFGIVAATIPHAMFYATLAGLLSQVFPVETRYTGISLAYQTGTALFAGTTPILCQFLFNQTGSVVSVVGLGVVYTLLSIVASTILLRRTAESTSDPQKPLTEEEATQ
ncbi:MFS transporter [Rhodococcus sp. NPDC127530]|uniref:MFS transporter n=1 Tax=unclassified Rhodococcus (in: high G+C Gram-positive bacteria) TaxID=192944 RepID=UPI00362D1F6B